MANQAPTTRNLIIEIPAAGAAVDNSLPMVDVPFPATITAVKYTPSAAITGAVTNSRTLSVVNKGSGGAGTATPASLALVVGVNPAADIDQALTLSGTAANLTVAAGDVLVFNSTHVGTGIADPGGILTVALSRNDG